MATRFLTKLLLDFIIICCRIRLLIFIPLLIILILAIKACHRLILRVYWKMFIILEFKIKTKPMSSCHCCPMSIQNCCWRLTLWESGLIILRLRMRRNLMFKKLLLISFFNFLKKNQPIHFKINPNKFLKMKGKKNYKKLRNWQVNWWIKEKRD